MTYATDGLCHNVEPGTFNHECGKPATWLGTKPNGFQCGFCDHCKRNGYEAQVYTDWVQHPAHIGSKVTSTCIEHGPGGTIRLSSQIKVF